MQIRPPVGQRQNGNRDRVFINPAIVRLMSSMATWPLRTIRGIALLVFLIEVTFAFIYFFAPRRLNVCLSLEASMS